MDASTSHEPPQRLSLGQPIPMTAHVVPAAGTASTSSGSAAASTGTAAAAGAASSSSSSSLINPTSLALSLPHSAHSVPVPLVDAQALHYLTLEMSHALRASAQRSARRRRRGLAMMQEAGFDVDPVDFAASSDASQQQQQQGVQTLEDSDGDETEVIKRLEAIGSHVGATFAERLSRDRPPFANTLDVLKFICKDLWTAMWEKQVDNLRTNHRGVYVLQDNVFKPLLRLSVPAGPAAAQELAVMTRVQLAMPTGVIRGALARLGVASTVVAETSQVPQCTFHVKTTTQRP